MTRLIDRAVKLRRRTVVVAGLAAVFWVVLPARPGKGSRTRIGPAHLDREQAVAWAERNGYLVLGSSR